MASQLTATKLAVLLLALCYAPRALGLTCYVSYNSFQVFGTCTDQGGDCPGILKTARVRPIPEKSNSVIPITIPDMGESYWGVSCLAI
jgi:hypothetical protein